MRLPGPIHDPTDAQMTVVKHATSLYARCAPIIGQGRTIFIGDTPAGWSHPTGRQGVWRANDDGDRALVAAHAFAQPDSRRSHG